MHALIVPMIIGPLNAKFVVVRMEDGDDNIDESYQIKVANACNDILAEVGLARSLEPAASSSMRIECANATSLSQERKEEIYKVTETNMKAIYIESGWGWNPIEKRNEFFHPLSRMYMLIDEASNQIAGFGIFRFEYDDEEEPEFIVLYIYELQIREAYRRMGYGAQVGDNLASGSCGLFLTAAFVDFGGVNEDF
jgi:hypothetical protein